MFAKLFAHPKTRIFLPCSDTEQIKGWLLHCHKSRDRHDMTARWLDRRHWTMTKLSAGFAALAGIAVAANLDAIGAEILGIPHLKFWAGLILGGLALIASFLTVMQKEARYGERAETHRRKAEDYKALIWDIEMKVPHLDQHKNEEWSREWLAKFKLIEKEQQVIVPEWIVNKVETTLYPGAIFVPRAQELLPGSPEPSPDQSGQASRCGRPEAQPQSAPSSNRP